MKYRIEEEWLTLYDEKKHPKIIDEYLSLYQEFIASMPKEQQRKECLSGFNRIKRMELWSSNALNIDIRIGDICYLEYGQAFMNEAGYQHFGLVVSVYNYKLLVIPMTSNAATIRQAQNVTHDGKKHLYYIGKVAGLNKPSVLFLNDCKFVNSSRIIACKARICPQSKMFKEIIYCLKKGIFIEGVIE